LLFVRITVTPERVVSVSDTNLSNVVSCTICPDIPAGWALIDTLSVEVLLVIDVSPAAHPLVDRVAVLV
jgi:hypothetical protein